MNKSIFLTAVALVGLTGVAHAAPPSGGSDESALTVDVLAATGHVYFLKCENGRDPTFCVAPSIWEDTNELKKSLQTKPMPSGNMRFLPDTELLG